MRPTVHTSALPYRAYRETDFKQTDIGPIPHDWEVVTLGEIGAVNMCKRVFKWQTNDTGEIPFFKIGTFGREPDAYISRSLFNRYKEHYPYPSRGAILLSAAGTIGRRVKYNGEEAYFQDSNIIWLRHDETRVLNDFLFYLYGTVNWITEKGSAISRLYNNLFLSTEIPLPPLPEQKRIAEVLDHLDEHIGNLTTLLQKRKLVKEAAMRELLSGSRRLPGYTGPWKKYTLGEIVSVERGELLRSSDFKNGTIPVVAGGMGIAGFHNRCNRGGKTITIGASGAAGFVNFYSSPIFASDCCTISENENYDIKFLYYDLKSMQADIYRLQSGGVQKHIYPKDLKSLSVVLPPSLEEQAAIATVLSHMDDDIEVLEQKIEKYRQLKEGVMQELLTGNTRLL